MVTQLLLVLYILLPTVSYGATVAAPSNFKGFVSIVTGLMGQLVTIIFALTFLAFMWGIIKGWIIGGGNAESVESGKKVVVASVVAFVVMISVWGIVSLLRVSLF